MTTSDAPPPMPRWVKAVLIVVAVAVTVIVILHLTGNGFGHLAH